VAKWENSLCECKEKTSKASLSLILNSGDIYDKFCQFKQETCYGQTVDIQSSRRLRLRKSAILKDFEELEALQCVYDLSLLFRKF